MLEVALGRDSPGAPPTTLWFAVPAIGAHGAAAASRAGASPSPRRPSYWLVAAALSFVDGRLIAFIASASASSDWPPRSCSATSATRCRRGSAWPSCSAATAIIVYNIPGHSPSELVFIPLLFGIGWLAGYALRERAEQAEAAEVRATQAEREREAAARVAVAEERARIARELHDVVAHAVSVMVLQVGAVRHKLPTTLDEDRDALERVEQAGRTALAEMRRLLGAMRRDGDGVELAPQPGLDSLDSLVEDVGRAGLPVRLHVDGEPFRLPRGDRPLRLPNRAGRPDERAQARAREPART